MKYCTDCKYIGMPFHPLYPNLTGNPEYDSICLHEKAKLGDPSMVMKEQARATCYNMRKTGECGIDAKLYVAKSKDKPDVE